MLAALEWGWVGLTKPKVEDEGRGKGVLRVGVGCLKAVNLLLLPNWWWRVGLFASRATWPWVSFFAVA